MIYLINLAIAAVAAEIAEALYGRRRTPYKPKDRAQRRGGTGHFLVLVGPDRCRCGASWPCVDSVAADRLTRQI